MGDAYINTYEGRLCEYLSWMMIRKVICKIKCIDSSVKSTL